MSEFSRVIELELIPIPPDTTLDVKREVQSIMEVEMNESYKESFLLYEHIRARFNATFPADSVVMTFAFSSKNAYPLFYRSILPKLSGRFITREIDIERD